ncbi:MULTISPECIES: glycosyltransferase [unclassified Halomonas]|uniref:glycosyltransferase n=1 Tax=unclassified Halomonas TaxID=2609666 RepID=UPI002076B6BA|nr:MULTISPECIES: glycosyltransferase [unclassified Halomonas]
MRKHIFFLIRFSVFTKSKSAWAIGNKVDMEVYKQNLFDRDRLLTHQAIFEKVTLPGLDSMMDAERATALVFISEELPEEFESRLRALSEQRTWLKIVKVRSEKALNRQIDLRVAKELERFEFPICCASVRLDDDDALASDYCTVLERHMYPHDEDYCVTFPEGILSVYAQNRYTDHYQHRQINNAQGLAMVKTLTSQEKVESPITVFSVGNHTNVDKRYPVVMDSRQRMFIRTEHAHSDLVAHGGRERDKAKMVLLDQDDHDDLKARFAFFSVDA